MDAETTIRIGQLQNQLQNIVHLFVASPAVRTVSRFDGALLATVLISRLRSDTAVEAIPEAERFIAEIGRIQP